MRILRRYIWKEFSLFFCASGLVLTVLGIGKIVFDYNDFFIGYRVTAGLTIRLILNQLPSLMMDVIPAATVCGVILALGRLLLERELDVIRISGVGISRIMMPIFSGVFLICIGAYGWNDLVVPAANHRFQTEVRRLSNQQNLPFIKEKVVIRGPYNRFIYLDRVESQTGRIRGVLIMETGAGPGLWPRIITAATGRFSRGTWRLFHGVIHQLDQSGSVVAEARYDQMKIKMGLDYGDFIDYGKTLGEMRTGELLDVIRRNFNNPAYLVAYHAKFADPLISLVLAFLAAPMTFATGRRSRWVALGFGLLVVLGYYALQVIGRTAGNNGVITPWLAAWAPHMVFLVLGIILVNQIERRR